MKIRSCQTKQVTVFYFWMSNAGKGRKKFHLEKNSILIPKPHFALDGDIKTRTRISFLQDSITKWNSMRQKRQWPLIRFSSRITAGEISWGTFSSAWNDFYVEHGLAFSVSKKFREQSFSSNLYQKLRGKIIVYLSLKRVLASRNSENYCCQIFKYPHF